MKYRLIEFQELESTQSYVVSLILEGCYTDQVIVANNQTKGQGRYKTVWHSFPGCFTFSFATGHITLLQVCDAICDSISDITNDAYTKWPNDVMIGSHKVAGVLITTVSGRTVVGVGVNLYGESGCFKSIDSLTGVKLTKDAFFESFIGKLERCKSYLRLPPLVMYEGEVFNVKQCVGPELVLGNNTREVCVSSDVYSLDMNNCKITKKVV